jgi:hypothetical protein
VRGAHRTTNLRRREDYQMSRHEQGPSGARTGPRLGEDHGASWPVAATHRRQLHRQAKRLTQDRGARHRDQAHVENVLKNRTYPDYGAVFNVGTRG